MGIAVTDVFTPTKPATYTFVERDASTSRRIEQALRTPGMQIVVYGPTGSGKTTLIRNKLDQFGPGNSVICRCTSTSTFEEIVRSALSKINAKYVAEETRGGGARSGQLGGSLLGTGASVGYIGKTKPAATEKSVTAPPVSVEQLGEYLGRATANLIIEDVHKVEDETKARIAEAMKLFMDLAADFPELKIIALGARETAEDILRLDIEMKNRVAEIGVDPMNKTELKEILGKGGECLNVEFPPSVADRMASFACGMPAVVHQLALTMCFEAGVAEPAAPPKPALAADQLNVATRTYVEDQAASFRAGFEAATRSARRSKYDNYREILHALSLSPLGLTRSILLDRIRHRYPRYPASNLDACLGPLSTAERGDLIVKDPTTQRFRFRDPQACAYAAMRFATEKWADYCIQSAHMVGGLVERVRVRRDEGSQLLDEQTWNRAEVIDAMLKGTTFVTTVHREGGWSRLNEVTLVQASGQPYLRIDGLEIDADSLGEVSGLDGS